MSARAPLAAFLLALVLLPGVAGAVPRVESQSYVAPTGDVAGVCPDLLGAPNLGGACFHLDGSETSAHVTISDKAGWPVRGEVIVRKADGTMLSDTRFCASTVLPLPASSVYFDVLARVNGYAACYPGGGPATAGTVTAAFT